MKTEVILAATAALCAAGCIQLKTESEIKPIHITMDVNLKVDKDLDKAFADENNEKPKGNFKAVKAMVDRQAAGIRLAFSGLPNAVCGLPSFVPEDNAQGQASSHRSTASARICWSPAWICARTLPTCSTAKGEGCLEACRALGEHGRDHAGRVLCLIPQGCGRGRAPDAEGVAGVLRAAGQKLRCLHLLLG